MPISRSLGIQLRRTESKARNGLTRLIALRDEGKLDAPEGRTMVDALGDGYKLVIKNSKPKGYDWIGCVWRKNLEPFLGGRLLELAPTSCSNTSRIDWR